MARIAIRCHASHTIGLGHLVRQLNLGKALRNRGHEIVLSISNFSPAIEVAAKSGIPFQAMDDEDEWSPKSQNGYDLVILDVSDTDEDFVRDLRKHTNTIVSFDDLGPGRDYVDLMIDENLEEGESENVSSKVRTLFGSDYAVLHPDFETLHRKPRIFSSTIKKVLVTFGGTDPCKLTVPIAQSIIQHKPDLSLTVILGPGFSEQNKLRQLMLRHKRLKVLDPIFNMAETIAAHDVIFCSGGITLQEALAVGTPAFVISQVPAQEKKARTFEQEGAAVNLGLAGEFREERVAGPLDTPKATLEQMCRNGKRLIDGKGLKRVVQEIEKMIQDKKD